MVEIDDLEINTWREPGVYFQLTRGEATSPGGEVAVTFTSAALQPGRVAPGKVQLSF